ncbi:MAG TPA: PilZ domain-containing protein [Candidatus Methylomirabilis sp.]|nr:PilZ domain-containing protein [Candidatus Methylomirabilis sp.]
MSHAGKPIAQRRHARFPVSLAVAGRTSQFPGEPIHGTACNISCGGLMAEFPLQIVSGSILGLTLKTPWGPLGVEAKVVWTVVAEGTIRHGVVFSEPIAQDLAVDLFVVASK